MRLAAASESDLPPELLKVIRRLSGQEGLAGDGEYGSSGPEKKGKALLKGADVSEVLKAVGDDPGELVAVVQDLIAAGHPVGTVIGGLTAEQQTVYRYQLATKGAPAPMLEPVAKARPRPVLKEIERLTDEQVQKSGDKRRRVEIQTDILNRDPDLYLAYRREQFGQ